MDRRNFIKRSSTLSAMAITPLPTTFTLFENKPKFKMGYQLFSIRDEMEKEPGETLKALKGMGYQDFEIYGFDEKERGYYGFKASGFKNILDDLELTATSGHYGFSDHLHSSDDDLKRYVDSCIEGAHAIKSNYITWPWMAPEQRTPEIFNAMPRKLNMIGEHVSKAGLGFAYHNHGFEFEDYNGQTGYEIILRETDPELVKLQLDLYWVMRSSKRSPKEWIDLQPGRFVMWHIKDMDRATHDYTELGNGSIDYLKELPDPKKSGLEHYYIEQGGNFSESSMASALQSAKYFKEHLQKFL